MFDNSSVSPPDEDKLFEFNIPSNMCGLFIGSHGKTIKSISQQSGTRIRIQPHPYTNKFQICIVEGMNTKACNKISHSAQSGAPLYAFCISRLNIGITSPSSSCMSICLSHFHVSACSAWWDRCYVLSRLVGIDSVHRSVNRIAADI